MKWNWYPLYLKKRIRLPEYVGYVHEDRRSEIQKEFDWKMTRLNQLRWISIGEIDPFIVGKDHYPNEEQDIVGSFSEEEREFLFLHIMLFYNLPKGYMLDDSGYESLIEESRMEEERRRISSEPTIFTRMNALSWQLLGEQADNPYEHSAGYQYPQSPTTVVPSSEESAEEFMSKHGLHGSSVSLEMNRKWRRDHPSMAHLPPPY